MKLELYHKPTCPFCIKVMRFINENGIDGIKFKNKSANPEYEKELIKVGGKSQVPCLFIDGKPMYESDDIIDWLQTNKTLE